MIEDTRLYLKIKIKSLTEETRIIRREESKQRELRKVFDTTKSQRANKYFWGLRAHRQVDIREEQRATLLAYAYLRGKTYASVEGNAHKGAPAWDRVRAMVSKYGPKEDWRTPVDMDPLEDWIKSAGWIGDRREV